MASDSARCPRRQPTRSWGATVAFRLFLLAAIILGPAPAAGVALAQQQPAAAFPRSAGFLPAPTGFYLAVNLAPDAAQRGTLDRLFNYYMQDADFASSWREMIDSR